MNAALMILLALLIDVMLGWPDRVFRRISHPVVWLGAAVTALENRWNSGTRGLRIAKGGALVAVVVLLAVVPMLILQHLLPEGCVGIVLAAILAWPFLAAKSLHQHVARVMRSLQFGQVSQARRDVSMIVGRDPDKLTPPGIARAAIESLSENASDGLIAPMFWGLILGLPGLAAYKAINTMDSMIGHRSERYEAFGKVAARLDDVVNWIPARLTGLLFVLAAQGRRAEALGTLRADAGKHRSPNAGWPEAAMAGALNLRLSGPRQYGDHVAQEPWVNPAGQDPKASDIGHALSVYHRAVAIFALALLLLTLV